MSEYNLCAACTMDASERYSDLMLSDSRPCKGRCDNCGEKLNYEYVFVRVDPLKIEAMEAM